MRNCAPGRRGESGFTIAEAIIAVVISAMCLGGVMLLNAQQLKVVRSTRQSNAASLALQDRVEQLRLTSWSHLVDTNWLQNEVFEKAPDCAQFLANYSETLRITPWPDSSTATNLEVVSNAKDGFKVTSSGTGMKDERQGQVNIIVTWTGADNRKRERSYATIISNGGITRVGLSGYGSYSGSSDPTNSTDSTGSGNSGNGKGRGNTGGKPGTN